MDCPCCGKSVPLSLINSHLDSRECEAASTRVPAAKSAPPAAAPVYLPVADIPLATTPESVPAAPMDALTAATAPVPSEAKGHARDAFAELRRGAAELKPRTLCWTLTPGPPPELLWHGLTHEMAHGGWAGEVMLRRCVPPVQLVLRQGRAPEANPGIGVNVTLADISVGVLKSALQKNVRLCRPLPALRCAWALLRLAKPTAIERAPSASGAEELLRRLPIIAIEDALPPPLLPQLIWLMAAHTSSKTALPLTAAHVNLILACTLQMACGRWREVASVSAGASGAPGAPSLSDAAMAVQSTHGTRAADAEPPLAGDEGEARDDPNLDEDVCEAVSRALLVRAEYGGMPGDMAMLHAAAATWASRAARPRDERRRWAARLRLAAMPAPLVEALVHEALHGGVLPPLVAASAGAVAAPVASGDGRGGASSARPPAAFEAEVRRAMRGEGGLEWADLPLSAFDFHCCRRVLDRTRTSDGTKGLTIPSPPH